MREELIEEVLVFTDGLLEGRYTEDDYESFLGIGKDRYSAEEWLALEEASEGAGVPVTKKVTKMYIPKSKSIATSSGISELYVTPRRCIVIGDVTGIWSGHRSMDAVDIFNIDYTTLENEFVPYRITLDPKELCYDSSGRAAVLPLPCKRGYYKDSVSSIIFAPVYWDYWE